MTKKKKKKMIVEITPMVKADNSDNYYEFADGFSLNKQYATRKYIIDESCGEFIKFLELDGWAASIKVYYK